MAIRDEVAAIVADDQPDKLRRIRRLKALRISEAANGLLPHTWTRIIGARTWSLTIEQVEFDGENISVWATVKRGNTQMIAADDPQNPFVFVNPPLLIPDAAGDVDLGESGKFREAPFQALKDALFETVRTVLRA
jgi:hypothetical protein